MAATSREDAAGSFCLRRGMKQQMKTKELLKLKITRGFEMLPGHLYVIRRLGK